MIIIMIMIMIMMMIMIPLTTHKILAATGSAMSGYRLYAFLYSFLCSASSIHPLRLYSSSIHPLFCFLPLSSIHAHSLSCILPLSSIHPLFILCSASSRCPLFILHSFSVFDWAAAATGLLNIGNPCWIYALFQLLMVLLAHPSRSSHLFNWGQVLRRGEQASSKFPNRIDSLWSKRTALLATVWPPHCEQVMEKDQ
jgi:hypothetical protein